MRGEERGDPRPPSAGPPPAPAVWRPFCPAGRGLYPRPVRTGSGGEGGSSVRVPGGRCWFRRRPAAVRRNGPRQPGRGGPEGGPPPPAPPAPAPETRNRRFFRPGCGRWPGTLNGEKCAGNPRVRRRERRRERRRGDRGRRGPGGGRGRERRRAKGRPCRHTATRPSVPPPPAAMFPAILLPLLVSAGLPAGVSDGAPRRPAAERRVRDVRRPRRRRPRVLRAANYRHPPGWTRWRPGGARFTAHYSGFPVCAPARCSLMTGRHAGHCEIRGNGFPAEPPEDSRTKRLARPEPDPRRDAVTVAELFPAERLRDLCGGQVGPRVGGQHRRPDGPGVRPVLRLRLPVAGP